MSLRYEFATLVLVGALLSCGCDTSDATVIGPSRISTPAAFVSRGVQVRPSFDDPAVVPGAVCPTAQPFLAPFSLIFEGDGRSDLSLSRVHMQFTDRLGIAGESMILDGLELRRRFGSTALPASGLRTLPFAFPFGCVGGPTGTLTVVVFTADSLRRENSSRVLIPIRRLSAR
jgi:hypothetical protein